MHPKNLECNFIPVDKTCHNPNVNKEEGTSISAEMSIVREAAKKVSL